MLISHGSNNAFLGTNSCRMTVMQTQQHQCGPHGGYQKHIKVMLVSAKGDAFEGFTSYDMIILANAIEKNVLRVISDLNLTKR
jgi:hypothetical protein